MSVAQLRLEPRSRHMNVPLTLRGRPSSPMAGGVGAAADRFRMQALDKNQMVMAEEAGYTGLLELANHADPKIRDIAISLLGKLKRMDGGVGLDSASDVQLLYRLYQSTDANVQQSALWDLASMARVPACRPALADKFGLDNSVRLLGDASPTSDLDAGAALFISNMAADPVYASIVVELDGVAQLMKYARRATNAKDLTASAFCLASVAASSEPAAMSVHAAGGLKWLLDTAQSAPQSGLSATEHRDVRRTAVGGLSAVADVTPVTVGALFELNVHTAIHKLLMSTLADNDDGLVDNGLFLLSCMMTSSERPEAVAYCKQPALQTDIVTIADAVSKMTVAHGVLRKLRATAIRAQTSITTLLYQIAKHSTDRASLSTNKDFVRIVRDLERSDDTSVAAGAARVLQLLGLTLMRKIAEGDLRAREANERERRERERELAQLAEQQALEEERNRLAAEAAAIDAERARLAAGVGAARSALELVRAENESKRAREAEERRAREEADTLRLEAERARIEEERLAREQKLAADREENRRKFEEERIRLEQERDRLAALRSQRDAALKSESDMIQQAEKKRKEEEAERLRRIEEEKRLREEEERRKKEAEELRKLAAEEAERERQIREIVEKEMMDRGEQLTEEALLRAQLEARLKEEHERVKRLQEVEAELAQRREQDEASRRQLEQERKTMEAERAEMEAERKRLKELNQLAERERQIDPRILELMRGIRLERYLPCFAHWEYDTFLDVSDDLLVKAGIAAVGPRQLLLATIASKRQDLTLREDTEAAIRLLMADACMMKVPPKQIQALARLANDAEESLRRRRIILAQDGLQVALRLIKQTRYAEVQSGAIKLLAGLLLEPHAKNTVAKAGGLEILTYLTDLKAFLDDTPTLAAVLNCIRRAIHGHAENRRAVRELNIASPLLDIGTSSVPRCPRLALELLSVLALENWPVQNSVLTVTTGIPRLLQLLDHPDEQRRETAIRSIGALCSGNVRNVQYSVFNAAERMERLVLHLGSDYSDDLRAAAASTIGYIAENEPPIQKALKERGAIRQLVRLLPSSSPKVQKAVSTAVRALCRGSPKNVTAMQDYMYRILAVGGLCQLAYSRRLGVKREALAALCALTWRCEKLAALVFNSIGTAAVVDGIRSPDQATQFYATSLLYHLVFGSPERREQFAHTNATPLMARLLASQNLALQGGARATKQLFSSSVPVVPVSVQEPDHADDVFSGRVVFAEEAMAGQRVW